MTFSGTEICLSLTKFFDAILSKHKCTVATLSKRNSSQHWCFPEKFSNFFSTSFFRTIVNEHLSIFNPLNGWYLLEGHTYLNEATGLFKYVRSFCGL